MIKKWFNKQFRYEPKQSDKTIETQKTSSWIGVLKNKINRLFFPEENLNTKTEKASCIMFAIMIFIVVVIVAYITGLKAVVFLSVLSIIPLLFPDVFKYCAKKLIVPCCLLLAFWCLPGNFATALITFVSVFYLSRALVEFNINNKSKIDVTLRRKMFVSMSICTIVIVIFACIPDNGYLTNSIGFSMALVAFYFLILKENPSWGYSQKEKKAIVKEKRYRIISSVSLFLVIILMPQIVSQFNNTEDINYNRMGRRMMLYSQFDDLRKAGYRYTENDVEFMTVLNHYMHEESTGDPLSNEEHYLHPSVSTGQSPVVLNDVSFPSSFVGAYGQKTILVFILLLVSLVLSVFAFSLSNTTKRDFDRNTQWRLLAMFMWIGTSAYIFISYYGRLPFTGRLIPGFGVDSVGEALESALLLAFIASTTISIKKQLRGY